VALSFQTKQSNFEITTMDVYAIVTEKIISLLEQGVVPWRRPWTEGGFPRNVVSKKPYRGINAGLWFVPHLRRSARLITS
jgi:antirestriction protein ArdC